MSSNTPIELDGWDVVSESLAEIRAGHEQSTLFFTKWFEQVESLLSDWLREQEQCQGEQDQAKSEDELWTTLLDHLNQTRGEVAETRAEVQRLVEPLESVGKETPDHQENQRLRAEIDALREEHHKIQAERSLLESELENIRRQAARLEDTLDTQRNTAKEQESYWREEFRRQCVLVEQLTGKLVQPATADDSTMAESPRNEPENIDKNEDFSLESVKAQFELLQGEATRRRQQNAGTS